MTLLTPPSVAELTDEALAYELVESADGRRHYPEDALMLEAASRIKAALSRIAELEKEVERWRGGTTPIDEIPRSSIPLCGTCKEAAYRCECEDKGAKQP